ncbi:MAG: pantoate--beta-alanine ligase [Acidobacteria bacterium]|nr:pantoate--beta-alanine ligase [Acidobacteriota bacterium]
MIILRRIPGTRAFVTGAQRDGHTVGLVPTMGALHAGHGALMDCARAACGRVVVTIFVNPIQFDRREDYEAYQVNLDRDFAFCEQRGVDAVFAPPVEEMYPEPARTFVEVSGVSQGLCGEFRPGHFRGVATVVSKLFHILPADRAYFGEKDAQQLAVIQRMVRDLDFPIEIVPVPTMREADGLAMSSRNQRLSPEERAAAPLLYTALCRAAVVARDSQDPAAARQAALEELARDPRFRAEYVEVVDPLTMEPLPRITGPACIAAAAWLGRTRLIDNVRLPAVAASQHSPVGEG